MALERRQLGCTGLAVTRLGFGSLPMGPMQARMAVSDGAAVIRYALERGVNFIDTAASYMNYAHVRAGVEGWPEPVIIASKTPARTYAQAELDVESALRELGVPRLDIFHIHGARVLDPFVEREEVLRCLVDYQRKGYIGAVGISTHSIKVVRQAADRPEIQVIHPLINMTGMGIVDGTGQEMADAIAYAHSRGKGIYAMKLLAGGNLVQQRQQAIRYVLGLTGIDAAVVGMLSKGEVDYNLAMFTGEPITPELEKGAPPAAKRLVVVRNLCQGCGECIQACPNGALSLQEEKSTVDQEKCILCGYCSPACPEFAIRMI